MRGIHTLFFLNFASCEPLICFNSWHLIPFIQAISLTSHGRTYNVFQEELSSANNFWFASIIFTVKPWCCGTIVATSLQCKSDAHNWRNSNSLCSLIGVFWCCSGGSSYFSETKFRLSGWQNYHWYRFCHRSNSLANIWFFFLSFIGRGKMIAISSGAFVVRPF